MRVEAKLRSRNAGFLCACLYASFLVFLFSSAVPQAISHFLADAAFRTGSEAGLAESLRYQPENPDTYEKQGLVRLRTADFPGAAGAFEKAISLSQRDYLLWLRLGYARQMARDIDGASTAYLRSIELAPRYGQPPYYMGLMLLDAGRVEEGFEYIGRAADLDPSIYPLLRRLARKTFAGDAEAIEGAVRPLSRDARRELARYLIKYHYMTDSIRSFLLSDELSAAEKNEFVKYLLHKKNTELAREVWLSRSNNGDSNEIGAIHDGGFEALLASDPSGLGWQINQNLSATAVARDEETFHSGSKALKIRFAGNVELGRPVISQLAFVEPGRQYTLRFYYRSTEMITAGPAEIVISDGATNAVLARSAEIKDTGSKWLEQQVIFGSRDSRVALISLQRSSCSASPCPIFGDLSLDDFSIVIRPSTK
jgi:tetratricopeptide (TPR) repeat protein